MRAQSRETPAEPIKGADSPTPQRARQGVLPPHLPRAVLSPDSVPRCSQARPIAFLIVPSQSRPPGAGETPPAAASTDHTTEASDGGTGPRHRAQPLAAPPVVSFPLVSHRSHGPRMQGCRQENGVGTLALACWCVHGWKHLRIPGAVSSPHTGTLGARSGPWAWEALTTSDLRSLDSVLSPVLSSTLSPSPPAHRLCSGRDTWVQEQRGSQPFLPGA